MYGYAFMSVNVTSVRSRIMASSSGSSCRSHRKQASGSAFVVTSEMYSARQPAQS